MNYFKIFLVFFSLTSSICFSQEDALIQLKFEEAEKAYNNREYNKVLEYLNEVEKSVGVSSKTLYLRVVAENQLLNRSEIYTDVKEFERMKRIRTNSSTYINVMKNYGLDARFKEVVKINEEMNEYPTTETEWEKMHQEKLQQKQIEEENARKEHERLELQKREKAERERIEAEKQQLENERIAREQEIARKNRREEEMRDNSFSSIYAAYALPFSSDVRNKISESQWSMTETPFTSAMRKNQMGIKAGLTIGLSFQWYLKKLSELFQNKRLAWGLNTNLSNSFMFFNFKNIPNHNYAYKYFFEESQTSPFGIVSLGTGPVFTYRVGSSKTQLNAYVRCDVNMFYWGDYESSGAGTLNSYDAAAKGVKFSASPTIGLSVRLKNVFFGIEFKPLLKYKANVYDEIINEINYNGSHTKTIPITNGINLSNVHFSIGATI